MHTTHFNLTFEEPWHGAQRDKFSHTTLFSFLLSYLHFSFLLSLSEAHTENVLTKAFKISWEQESHAWTEHLLYVSILLEHPFSLVHQLIWRETLLPSPPQCSSVLHCHTSFPPLLTGPLGQWDRWNRDLVQICLCGTRRTLVVCFFSVTYHFLSQENGMLEIKNMHTYTWKQPIFLSNRKCRYLFSPCLFINVGLKALI